MLLMNIPTLQRVTFMSAVAFLSILTKHKNAAAKKQPLKHLPIDLDVCTTAAIHLSTDEVGLINIAQLV